MHSAGKIDKKFQDRIKRHPAEYSRWSALRVGDSFPVDADMVGEFTFLVINLSCALFSLANENVTRKDKNDGDAD